MIPATFAGRTAPPKVGLCPTGVPAVELLGVPLRGNVLHGVTLGEPLSTGVLLRERPPLGVPQRERVVFGVPLCESCVGVLDCEAMLLEWIIAGCMPILGEMSRLRERDPFKLGGCDIVAEPRLGERTIRVFVDGDQLADSRIWPLLWLPGRWRCDPSKLPCRLMMPCLSRLPSLLIMPWRSTLPSRLITPRDLLGVRNVA